MSQQTLLKEIMDLQALSREQLLERYSQLFNGEMPATTHKVFLWRRLAYRMQELAYGGLSEQAQTRLKELTQQYDPVNNKALRPPSKVTKTSRKRTHRDRRLPIPGTVIVKNYKGTDLHVKVLEKGFEYNGRVYSSLSAVATDITGDHWSGFKFFRL